MQTYSDRRWFSWNVFPGLTLRNQLSNFRLIFASIFACLIWLNLVKAKWWHSSDLADLPELTWPRRVRVGPWRWTPRTWLARRPPVWIPQTSSASTCRLSTPSRCTSRLVYAKMTFLVPELQVDLIEVLYLIPFREVLIFLVLICYVVWKMAACFNYHASAWICCHEESR